jgi:hypothetical protein
VPPRAVEQGLPDRCPRRCLAGCMRSRGKRRGGVIAWMLDDAGLREQQRTKAAQRRPARTGRRRAFRLAGAEVGMLAFTIAVERWWSRTMTNRSRSMPQRP